MPPHPSDRFADRNRAAATPPGPTRPARRADTPPTAAPVPRGAGWWPAALAVLTLALSRLLMGGTPAAPVWSPQVGLGLVLVAWFGFRAGAGLLLGAGLLTVVAAAAAGRLDVGGERRLLAEAFLQPLEAVGAWWVYHSLARGGRRLADPRSAMQFVLLVPGLVAATAALARLLLGEGISLAALGGSGGWLSIARFWLADALGLLVIAPPLLVLASSLLERRGWVRPEVSLVAEGDGLPGPPPEATACEETGVGSPLGDWLEIAGLAIAAGVLCLLLGRVQGGGEWLGWQLWGGQLLLIAWAALRQGLPGGTVVASAAAVLPLLADAAPAHPVQGLILRGHLAAQSAAALLVAAGSSWIRRREAGYRRVVSLVPVVIYSARLLKRPSSGEVPSTEAVEGLAEVTLVSSASLQLLGHAPHALLGDYSGWLSCVYAEDREVVLAALGQLARQHEPVTCEYRLAPDDGGSVRRSADVQSTSLSGEVIFQRAAPRWMRDTLVPRRDASGRLVGWEGVVTEITEQRALADDLRRTTSMFHALVGNLPAGVFFVQGPHGQPLLVNARARQLLGQREDTSAGLDYLPQVYRLFRPDGTPFPAAELPVSLALKQGRTTMRDDIVVHRPDGRKIPLVTWAAPVALGGRKSPPAAVWVLEDLTAVRQAEAARKDTEGRLRVLIETMAEGLLVFDDKGRVVSANPAARAFFGTADDAWRGKAPAELPWSYVDEQGRPITADDFPSQAALRTGRPVRQVVLGVRPAEPAGDGSCPPTRWALVNAVPLGAEPEGEAHRGPLAGVVATFTDLTAYVQAREAIRASEERYRGLVESLPVMVVQSDLERRITYANPATTAITGYSLAEIAEPQSWSAMIHPDDLPLALRLLQSSLAGQSDQGELRYRARDGSEQYAFCVSQPRFHNGAVIGTTMLLVDLTRERRLEGELRRAQRMELIGKLSAGVAHDFNNLLGVVLNLTDLARGHLPAEHPVHADLRRIAEASEAAAALASQMLALSKQRPAPARRVDLNAVARRTLELLAAAVPPGISVEADLAPGEAPVLADETHLQQVLMNLCLNARDAMPVGGVLRVETACADGQVRLRVSDTGQGMSEEVRGRIFEPFFSTKEGGTGLGLAVVGQVVESHGGRVSVASEPGRGTHFDVSWPTAG